MDQLKEILKQAIKYRFWIAVGVSALMAMTAYFVGAGPVKAKADTESAKIKKADADVKPYSAGTQINGQYRPVVAEKTEVLTKDVNATWKKLYARQAPLLTWPDRVQDKFTKWGRKWPENVDSGAVQLTIVDYVNAYPTFVTEVYKTFKPFDPVTGNGVVTAPPEAALLQPSTFTIETPPDLGKVWAAQEKLWIQRTLLDVVAQVNRDAKDWDGAIIKQIEALLVGSPLAQDQRSLVKGDALEEAPSINDPAKPAEPAAESGGGGGAGPGPAGGADMASRYSSGSMTSGGMYGGGMGGGAAGPGDSVFYIKSDSTQFKIMPVEMVVLIDQSRIQDFLVALENSPMNVQVMDFEMAKPNARVVKPEKGAAMSYGMGMGGGYEGMMRGMPGAGGMTGMGGNYGRSMGRMMSMMPGGGMYGGGMGGGGMYGGGMGGPAPDARKGVDKRGENLAKKREEQEKAAKGSGKNTLHDPYYNIVEVKIYGQARFFNPPPEEAPAEPSQSEAAAPADAEKKAEETPKADAEKKAEETPKGDAEKKAEPEKKAEEAPKADAAKKGDTEKAEPVKKAEEAPKADAEKKADAPKEKAAEAAKPDAEKKAEGAAPKF